MPKESRAIERRYMPVNMAKLSVESRADGEEKRKVIQGYAAKFNEWADLGWFMERIAPGAFTNAIKNSDVRALFNHNADNILGRNTAGTLTLSEDDTGLWIEVDPPDTQVSRDLMVSIERGDVTQQSFAFAVVREEWEKADGEQEKRTLLEVELFDVSPVTYPAYENTNVSVESKSVAEVYEMRSQDVQRGTSQQSLPDDDEPVPQQSLPDNSGGSRARMRRMRQRINTNKIYGVTK